MKKLKCKSFLGKTFVGLLLVSMVLSGCGSSSSDSKKYSDSGYPEAKYSGAMATAATADYYSDDLYSMEEAASFEAGDMVASEQNGMETTQAETVSDNRKLIKTVNLDAETEEFDKFIANIDAKITALGGYAESKNIGGRSYNDAFSNRYAYITARIPSARLDEFVSSIETVSNITNKTESIDDVTLQYVDMEAHIESLRTEQKRLDELIMEAEDLETILTLEARLTEVRYQLESYESQLRAMQNKVDYSTIYLNVSEVKRVSLQPEYEKTAWERIASGFMESLTDVLDDIGEFFIGFIIALPRIIAFLLFVFVFVMIIVLIVKLCIKRAKSKPERLQKKYEKRMLKQQKKAQNYANNESEGQ